MADKMDVLTTLGLIIMALASAIAVLTSNHMFIG